MKWAILIFAALVLIGCGDSPEEGNKTALKIEAKIHELCGTTESREAGGPRTITPIDLDGESGPSGYLVTCVTGRVAYVEATE